MLKRKERKRQAILTVALMALVLFEGVHLAHRHLGARTDFSEDQLFAISPGTRSILSKLEDRLQVKAFFTSEVHSGEWSLIKARVETQIKEFGRLAGQNMGLTVQDPSVLSAAAQEAESFGIDPLPVVTARGGEENRQLVYLGAVLRYRGRTEVLPLINPWSFEVDFASAVQRLLRDQRLRLGWTGEPLDPGEAPFQYGHFNTIQNLLRPRMDIVEIPAATLEAGASIPETLDLLLVLRPLDWHPRAVFALDQYIQKGGRALICLDQVRSHPLGLAEHNKLGKPLPGTGLEAALQAYGAPLIPGHIWDSEWPGTRGWIVPDLDAQGKPTNSGRLEPIADPACFEIKPDGFERTFPPTDRASTAQFFWGQAFGDSKSPPGVTRLEVMHTSEAAYIVPLVAEAIGDLDQIEGQTRTLLASGTGQRLSLSVVLSGLFASPFAKGAPAPFDATTDDRGAKVGITEEPVLQGVRPAQVILVGDSDWIRDPLPGDYAQAFESASPANLRLFESMVDWLSQEEDLIAVRSKEPRDRPLRNFLDEELREAGIYATGAARSSAEMRDRLRSQDKAESRATRARWSAMCWPLLCTLALVFLLAGLWNWKERARA